MIKIIGIILALVISASAFGSYIIPSGGVTTVKIAAQAVTQAKLAPRAEVTPSPSATPAAAGSVAVSSTSGNFSTSSGTFVIVTNLQVGITTTGRPVEVEVLSDGATAGYIGTTTSTTCVFEILSGSTAISIQAVGPAAAEVPSGALRAIDYPSAGNQIYSVKVESLIGTTCYAQYAVLVAHEL